MSRDYAHEEWIPWYTRDTAGWMELSLAARGAAEGIARKMGRDGDEIPLGSRGLRGLARVLACSWEELEPALQELLRPGPDGEPPRLVHDVERCVLRDPEASNRRRPTSTERVRSLRGRRQANAVGEPAFPVASETRETVSSVSSCSETGATVPSPSDLISSDLISEKIPEEIPFARARAEPPEPRFSAGTTQVEALDRFTAAVGAATGRAFRLSRAPYHGQDLCAALNAHAPPGSLASALSWLEEQIRAWVAATDPKRAGGYAPSKLLDWLNAGRPDHRERPKSIAEITKQPFDPDAPWIKLGETGS